MRLVNKSATHWMFTSSSCRIGSSVSVLTSGELAAVYRLAIQVMDHPMHGTLLGLS
jgi:hypothetical protein